MNFLLTIGALNESKKSFLLLNSSSVSSIIFFGSFDFSILAPLINRKSEPGSDSNSETDLLKIFLDSSI